jgi:uncharacterized protein (DUF302 family)
MDYGFTKESDVSVDEVIDRLPDILKAEGFGILTRIDTHEKFKKALGLDTPRYIILGACHPASAHEAIESEESIGLLLPCNIIVYEKKNGKTGVGVIKPTVAMSMVENPALGNLALDIEEKLKRIFQSI